MSNSIWHKKHVFVVNKNGQVIVKLDDGTYDIVWVKKDKALQDVVVFSENGIKFIEEYCWLTDLIAQADKAERLQKAVDLLSKYLQLYMDDYANEFDADGIYNDEIERQERIWNKIKQLIKD